jgi:hypothetical protein
MMTFAGAAAFAAALGAFSAIAIYASREIPAIVGAGGSPRRSFSEDG